MRANKVLAQVRQALGHLNPADVRKAAEQAVTIEIGAPTPEGFEEIEDVLVPPGVTERKKKQARASLVRAGEREEPATLRIYHASGRHPEGTFLFYPEEPKAALADVIEARPDLRLALARVFPGFRDCVARDLIVSVAKENAMFALATALPSVIPLVSLPVAVGEFASDAAVLTINQVRLTFLLAAASGHKIGYRQQKTEIASIIAGAVGWRSLARELVGQIPFGGGVLPKAAIAFAGTYVVGASLERVYRLGYGYTPTEREAAYKDAFERGKTIATAMLNAYRQRRIAV